MKTIEVFELNDAELEVTAGRMNCNTAFIVYQIYGLAGDAFWAIGDRLQANYWDGRASGALDAGCGLK